MNDNPQKMPPVPPFVRFVASAVPMVFDNSLSYYEALCALWKYIQSMTDVINNNATLEEEYIEKFNELKGFVDNYFENLDVQEEINNKLDAMVEDGTLSSIIGSYVDTYVTETNARLQAVEESDAAQDTEIQNLLSAKTGLIGITKTLGNYYLVYSPDGNNFYSCGDGLGASFGNDASHLCKIGDYYYYVSTNNYRFSKDLINWSDKYQIKTGRTGDTSGGQAVWGNFIMYDETSEKVYAYSAFQYNSNTVVNAVGSTTHYFKICYQEGTLNDDHTITWDQTEQDLLYDSGESYIDPFVINHPTLGWIIAYKDEKLCQIKIGKMSSKFGPVTNIVTAPVQGVEAPKLIMDKNGSVICYVDGYNIFNTNLTGGTTGLPYLDGYFYVVFEGSMVATTKMGLIPIKESSEYRHLGLMKCEAGDIVNIQKIGINSFPDFDTRGYKMGRGYVTPPDNGIIFNHPNIVYILSGTKTITVKTIFQNEPLVFTLGGNADITITSDSWVTNYAKGRHMKGDTLRGDQTYIGYPDTRNITDGLRLPVDTTT